MQPLVRFLRNQSSMEARAVHSSSTVSELAQLEAHEVE